MTEFLILQKSHFGAIVELEQKNLGKYFWRPKVDFDQILDKSTIRWKFSKKRQKYQVGFQEADSSEKLKIVSFQAESINKREMRFKVCLCVYIKKSRNFFRFDQNHWCSRDKQKRTPSSENDAEIFDKNPSENFQTQISYFLTFIDCRKTYTGEIFSSTVVTVRFIFCFVWHWLFKVVNNMCNLSYVENDVMTRHNQAMTS